MSSSISLIIILLVLLLIIANFYLRFVIIKQYNSLKNKGLSMDSQLFYSKKKRNAYIHKFHPENASELLKFSNHLDFLLKMVVGGFVLILICFTFMYLTSK